MTEFIGTFFLVFTVGMCVIKPDAGALAPIAIGSALMIMVYAGGHISGGHYNPAVAIGIIFTHLTRSANTWLYLVAELSAEAVSGATFRFLNPDDR